MSGIEQVYYGTYNCGTFHFERVPDFKRNQEIVVVSQEAFQSLVDSSPKKIFHKTNPLPDSFPDIVSIQFQGREFSFWREGPLWVRQDNRLLVAQYIPPEDIFSLGDRE